jgi:hypothetical protein
MVETVDDEVKTARNAHQKMSQLSFQERVAAAPSSPVMTPGVDRRVRLAVAGAAWRRSARRRCLWA